MCRSAFLFSCLCPLAAAQWEDPASWLRVRAEGQSSGIGSDARAQAERDAVEAALLQVVGAWVARDDLGALNSVLHSPARYAPRLDIVQVSESAGNTRIESDVFIRSQLLGRDVAAAMLPTLPAEPRVWLLIGEPGEGGLPAPTAEVGFLEKELAERLGKGKLEAAGTGLGQEQFPADIVTAAMRGDDDAALRIAVSRPADAIVIGGAGLQVEPAKEGNVARFRLTLRLKVYRGLDGTLAEDVQAEAAVYGTQDDVVVPPLLRDAAARVAEPLATAAVLTHLSRRTSGDVSLTIENPGSRERLAEVVQFVEGLSGPDAVEPLYYSEGLARLRVAYSGGMVEFTDALEDRVFDGRKAVSRRVVERDVVFRLR